jgi:hypothetical protein
MTVDFAYHPGRHPFLAGHPSVGSLIGFCPYAGDAHLLLADDVGLPFPVHQKPAGCEQHVLLVADVCCGVALGSALLEGVFALAPHPFLPTLP